MLIAISFLLGFACTESKSTDENNVADGPLRPFCKEMSNEIYAERSVNGEEPDIIKSSTASFSWDGMTQTLESGIARGTTFNVRESVFGIGLATISMDIDYDDWSRTYNEFGYMISSYDGEDDPLNSNSLKWEESSYQYDCGNWCRLQSVVSEGEYLEDNGFGTDYDSEIEYTWDGNRRSWDDSYVVFNDMGYKVENGNAQGVTQVIEWDCNEMFCLPSKVTRFDLEDGTQTEQTYSVSGNQVTGTGSYNTVFAITINEYGYVTSYDETWQYETEEGLNEGQLAIQATYSCMDE